MNNNFYFTALLVGQGALLSRNMSFGYPCFFSIHSPLKKKNSVFIFGCTGLRCCAQVFSSCDECRATLKLRGSAFSLQWLLLLLSTRSRAGLSYSVASMIFPDQGTNPRPLNWQADS